MMREQKVFGSFSDAFGLCRGAERGGAQLRRAAERGAVLRRVEAAQRAGILSLKDENC